MTELRPKDFDSPPADTAVQDDVAAVPQVGAQIGALCWRLNRGRVQVLLITSRDTGRWVIPKGWPMPDRAPAEAAAIEAWEEAGVRGDIVAAPLGLFDYDKIRAPQAALPCTVSVYPLRVASVATKYPERKQRQRRWFDAHKAAAKVAEPQLRALLAQLVVQDKTLTLQVKTPRAA